jgi:hypothetical protein
MKDQKRLVDPYIAKMPVCELTASGLIGDNFATLEMQKMRGHIEFAERP